jgi:integrase
VHLARRDLLVRRGKGGKQRVVALSASLRQALQTLDRREDGYVLGYRTAGSAWRRMQALCLAAGVTAKGVHALRHAAGTRLYAETHDLETTARHPDLRQVERPAVARDHWSLVTAWTATLPRRTCTRAAWQVLQEL